MAREYQQRDKYYKQAKKDGFVARSVYKLEEIDARHQLLKAGDRVVDFGCSPGSWLQYIGEAIGPKGVILGYDLVPPRVTVSNARTFVADIHELTAEIIKEHAEDPEFTATVVLSDMAPKTTGIRDADQARSIGLVEHALYLADALLVGDAVFAAKVFQGRGFDELVQDMKKQFQKVKTLRPKATRHGSREAFIIARGR
jgi:23S rRNA (uridine2552-2'-O)-methyltransferase